MNWEVAINKRTPSVCLGAPHVELVLGSFIGDVCRVLKVTEQSVSSDSLFYSAHTIRDAGQERTLVSPVVGVILVTFGRTGRGLEGLVGGDEDAEGSSRFLSVSFLLPMWQVELCFFGEQGGRGKLQLQAIYVVDENEAGVPISADVAPHRHMWSTVIDDAKRSITVAVIQELYKADNVTIVPVAGGGCKLKATSPTHVLRAAFKRATVNSAFALCLSIPGFTLCDADPSDAHKIASQVLEAVGKHAESPLTSEEIVVIPGYGVLFSPSGSALLLKRTSIQQCLRLLGEPSVTLSAGHERTGGPWQPTRDGSKGLPLKTHDLDSCRPVTLVYLDFGLEITFSGLHNRLERVTLRNPIPQGLRMPPLDDLRNLQVWRCSSGLSDVLGIDVGFKRPYFSAVVDSDVLSLLGVPSRGGTVVTISNWTLWSEFTNQFKRAGLGAELSASDRSMLSDLVSELLTPFSDEVVLDGVAFELVRGNAGVADQQRQKQTSVWDSRFEGTHKQFIAAVSVFASTTNAFVRRLSTEVVTETSGFGQVVAHELLSMLSPTCAKPATEQHELSDVDSPANSEEIVKHSATPKSSKSNTDMTPSREPSKVTSEVSSYREEEGDAENEIKPGMWRNVFDEHDDESPDHHLENEWPHRQLEDESSEQHQEVVESSEAQEAAGSPEEVYRTSPEISCEDPAATRNDVSSGVAAPATTTPTSPLPSSDDVPFLEDKQDFSTEVAGASWAAVAQNVSPEEPSDRMSPDSNRYATCATEEIRTPDGTPAHTPEFAPRFQPNDSSGSFNGGLIGRGMLPHAPTQEALPEDSDTDETHADSKQVNASSSVAARSTSSPSTRTVSQSKKKKKKRGKR